MQPATEPGDHEVTTRRRAVAQSGHVGDVATARRALVDPAAAVRSTALGALDRLDELADEELVSALADPDPSVRRRSAELCATRRHVDLLDLLDDPDPSVVEMTAWAMGEREESHAVGRLSELSSTDTGHGDPLCREAAVAALGAIGDEEGLAAILAALDDKPAIRRRAAVALAAFEGAAVDDALRRCLDDRDWQVRQVAEDLLEVDRTDIT